MGTKELIDLISTIASALGVNANLAVAIAGHETGFDLWKVRVEPDWKYFVVPRVFCQKLGISYETECTLQAMSWGPMQIMGSVCRELGFHDHLTLLTDPNKSIFFACKKLLTLKKQFPDEKDLISAYNQGAPVKVNGIYKNQSYVNDVWDRLTKLRQISKED